MWLGRDYKMMKLTNNEKQLRLNDKSKEELLRDLYCKRLSNYSKIITYFGNVNSKIMILGLAPVQEHLDSDSKSAFKFDLSLQQETKSGSIIIKVFKELDLDIKDYFWNNCYKIPIEIAAKTQEQKIIFQKLLEDEIEIIEPDTIICLGTVSFDFVKSLDIDVNINIKYIMHPAYVLRGGITISNYVNYWKNAMEVKK